MADAILSGLGGNIPWFYPEIKAPRIEDMLRQTGLLQYQNDKVKDFSLGCF
ncbi:hypothetical protein [Desulfosporosinus sp. FKA]|uniref:hypothetical protein n=1 Tax=Desulfosporosinus sp. FKA TaxID=1969834 RepID=UPI001A9A4CBD|nr:hypothetical protein [Desulfosporosinus sp. FKA]